MAWHKPIDKAVMENPIPKVWQDEYPPKYDVCKADTSSMVQWYDNTDPIKQTGGKKMRLFAKKAKLYLRMGNKKVS